MLASYLINWGRNPIFGAIRLVLEEILSKLNQSDVASDFAALVLTLSVKRPLVL